MSSAKVMIIFLTVVLIKKILIYKMIILENRILLIKAK